MGFIRKRYSIDSPIKATKFLLNLGYSNIKAQRIIDKGRLLQNNCIMKKSSLLEIGFVELIEFSSLDLGLDVVFSYPSRDSINQNNLLLRDGIELSLPQNKITKHLVQYNKSCLSLKEVATPSSLRGSEATEAIHILESKLKYQTNNNTNPTAPHLQTHTIESNLSFCIINKPAKLLTHPKSLLESTSLLEHLRYIYGDNCNPCHRLDYDTSGLVLCAMDKKSEIELKNLFASRLVHKEYLAIVKGDLKEPLYIESNIEHAKSGYLCVRGKSSNNIIRSLYDCEIDSISQGYLSLRGKATSLSLQRNLTLPSLRGSEATEAIHINKINSYNKTPNSTQAITLALPLKRFKDIHALNKFLESNFAKRIFTSNIFSNPSPNMPKAYTYLILSLIKEPKNSFSLVKFIPLTGRTHQLRIHANIANIGILGDTLYGIDDSIASFFLDLKGDKIESLESNYHNIPHSETIKELIRFYKENKASKDTILNDISMIFTGSNRLLLHAYRLRFSNFNIHS